MFKLHGVFAPIPTPFENEEVAYDRLAQNMDFWLNSKLAGIVVMGSNGEFIALSSEEKRKLIKTVCELAKGKKPVIAGTGCESTKETIDLTNYAAQCGAAAALVLSPNYYKKAINHDITKNFYLDIAEASPIPIILYNIPGNSGINLSAHLVAELSYHPNIIGIKDTGGNIVQIAEIIHTASQDFSVFAGTASYLFPSLVLGATGGTLALANLLPNECAEIVELVEAKRYDEAKDLQLRLLAINHAVTIRWGVAGLKAALEIMGLFGGNPRKPLLPVEEHDKKMIADILYSAKKTA
jgi:4-hydroxy-2-oxoglutarate aldolase